MFVRSQLVFLPGKRERQLGLHHLMAMLGEALFTQKVHQQSVHVMTCTRRTP